MSEVKTKIKDEKGVRLFDSDFMEFFTHISPIAVLVIFLPVIGFFVWRSIQANSEKTWWMVLILQLGF